MEDRFIDVVLGRLAGVRGLGCRAMFGGHGLFLGPTLFGIASGGRLYLKTDAAAARDYSRRGMRPFSPDREVLRTYYEVPPDVMGDAGRLAEWALAAARCAAPACADSAADGGAAADRAEHAA